MSVIVSCIDELGGVELGHNLVSCVQTQHSHEEGHRNGDLLEGLCIILASWGCGVDDVVGCSVDDVLGFLVTGFSAFAVKILHIIFLCIKLVLLIVHVCSFEDEGKH